MQRFIHNENIRLYRKLLEHEQDEERRNVIRKLLAEERGQGRVRKPERARRQYKTSLVVRGFELIARGPQ
jgi:rubrerythrin